MGGILGGLLAIFFAAAGAVSSGRKHEEALKAGLGRVREAGGARRGERTMIDALAPAQGVLEEGLGAAAKAVRAGADATAAITRAGRMGRAGQLYLR